MVLRIRLSSFVALSLAVAPTVGLADFTGPAPVAWRWAQSTSVTPGGSPLTFNETVVLAVGSRVYAVDRVTGNQRWRYPVGEPLNANFRNGAILAGDAVIAAADNKTLYCVDAATGQQRWTYTAAEPIVGTPVAAGKSVVFAQGSSGLMAVGLADGLPIWKEPYKLEQGLAGALSVYGSSVLLFTQDNRFMSLDVQTQRPVWNAGFASLNPDSRAVVFGDAIYVNNGPFLTALNATGGRPRWQVDFQEDLVEAPSVTADGISVVSREGRVYTIDLNGRFVIRKGIELQSAPTAAPAAVGRFICVPTANGSLNFIDPKTGDIVWNYIVRPMTPIQNPSTKNPNYVTAAAAPVLSGDTLLVLARDGSLLAFDKQNGVDLTAPTVRMTFPNPGDQVNGQPPFQLQFRIEDEASGLNLASVSVDINGQAYPAEVSRDGLAIVRFTEATKLRDGRQKIVVTASDYLGNIRKQEFAITIDNSLRPIGGTGGG